MAIWAGITKLTNGSMSTLKIADGHCTIINYDQTSHLRCKAQAFKAFVAIP